MFNSKIELKTQIDKGSRFLFDLEFEVCEEKVVRNQKQEETQIIKSVEKEIVVSNKNKILVVEENSLNRQLIDYLLTNSSFNYKIVSEKDEVFAELDKEVYSLVLSDSNFINEIIKFKEDKNLKSLFVVLMSPNLVDKNEQLDDILLNPISDEKLANILNKHLKKSTKKTSEKSNPTLIEVNYVKEDVMAQLGLDELTVDMLLDNFFLTLDNDLLKLEKAIESKDKESIIQAAHYLKGSCLNLAMNDASKLLQEIELKAKDEDDLDINLDILKSVFKQIKQVLKL